MNRAVEIVRVRLERALAEERTATEALSRVSEKKHLDGIAFPLEARQATGRLDRAISVRSELASLLAELQLLET